MLSILDVCILEFVGNLSKEVALFRLVVLVELFRTRDQKVSDGGGGLSNVGSRSNLNDSQGIAQNLGGIVDGELSKAAGGLLSVMVKVLCSEVVLVLRLIFLSSFLVHIARLPASWSRP